MGSGCKRNEPAILTSCRSDPPIVSAKTLAHNGLELVTRRLKGGWEQLARTTRKGKEPALARQDIVKQSFVPIPALGGMAESTSRN